MTTSTATTHRNPITCTDRNTIIYKLQRKKRHKFYKEERNVRDVGLAGSAGNGPAGGSGRAGGVESLAAAVEEEGVELGGEPLAGVLVDGSAHAAGAEHQQHRRRRRRRQLQQWRSKRGAAEATAVGVGGHDRMRGRTVRLGGGHQWRRSEGSRIRTERLIKKRRRFYFLRTCHPFFALQPGRCAWCRLLPLPLFGIKIYK